MCTSPDAFLAARVIHRLMAAGVPQSRAEAIGRKVARRARAKRNRAFTRHLAGVDEDTQLTVDDCIAIAGREEVARP